MTDVESQLRKLRQLAELRSRDFNDARARAKAVKEMHDRDLARLAQEFGLESVGDAQTYIQEKEAEIEQRLIDLQGRLG